MQYLEQYRQIFDGEKFLRKGKEITHKEFPAFDGGGARALIDKVLEEMKNRESVSILDWGCGTAVHWHTQCLLNKSKSMMNVLGEKVQCFYRYDPAYKLYSKKPSSKYDLVMCSDVLEHIPDNELESFFFEINSYVNYDGMIFYSISTTPSNNSFVDGTNMHVNLKSPSEWNEILRKYRKTKVCVVFNGRHNY